MEDYVKHYFQYRFEDYYEKVKCPLMMPTGEESESEQAETIMEGLCGLAQQGEIARVKGC